MLLIFGCVVKLDYETISILTALLPNPNTGLIETLLYRCRSTISLLGFQPSIKKFVYKSQYWHPIRISNLNATKVKFFQHYLFQMTQNYLRSFAKQVLSTILTTCNTHFLWNPLPQGYERRGQCCPSHAEGQTKQFTDTIFIRVWYDIAGN